MAFFLLNDQIDKQLKEMIQKFILSMNGITSANMKKYGIQYTKNYGVSIVRLREIASYYTPDHDLAQRLWKLDIREAMICATLLQPIEKFDKKTAGEWMNKVNNVELAEQITMNLLSKTTIAKELVFEYAGSTCLWEQITGFLLGTRIHQQFTAKETKLMIELAIRKSETEELHLYKCIANFLGRLCRHEEEMRDYVFNKIKSLDSMENTGSKYIREEVKQEILFLKNLSD